MLHDHHHVAVAAFGLALGMGKMAAALERQLNTSVRGLDDESAAAVFFHAGLAHAAADEHLEALQYALLYGLPHH